MNGGTELPKGYRKIEAYTNGKEIVALEWPESEDENHNCDAMGCSIFDHVKYRIAIPGWQALQQQPSEVLTIATKGNVSLACSAPQQELGTQGEQPAEVDAENPTSKSGSTMEGTDLAALVRRMNSAVPEQIAQAMEQMATDALEFGVKFESLSLPPQTVGRTPEWREKSGNLGGGREEMSGKDMNDWTAQAPMHIREQEPIRCYLFLTNDLIRIDCQKPMPNVWVRFWLKALLGWRWEKAGGPE